MQASQYQHDNAGCRTLMSPVSVPDAPNRLPASSLASATRMQQPTVSQSRLTSACCPCGLEKTHLSQSHSMLCVVGGHWSCTQCAPKYICTEHGKVSRCYITGPLWYNTIKATVTLEPKCPLGCLTGPVHLMSKCPRASTACISIRGHSTTGTITGVPALTRLIKRKGGGILHSTAILFEKKAFTILACITADTDNAHSFLLQSPYELIGIVATIPAGTQVGQIVTLELDDMASPTLIHTYSLLWPALKCSDILN